MVGQKMKASDEVLKRKNEAVFTKRLEFEYHDESMTKAFLLKFGLSIFYCKNNNFKTFDC